MHHRIPSLLAAVAALAMLGAGCEPQPFVVTVLGDSHSDVDRVPPHDWEVWAPDTWIINEHATRSWYCDQIVEAALEATVEDPTALDGDVMVIFCGTNDAAGAWNLAATMGWIQVAVEEGLARDMEVVVVAPPPAIGDLQIPANLRNQRLMNLRAEIYDLQQSFDFEVADVWQAILIQENIELLFAGDGLHLSLGGRNVAFQAISAAVTRARAP